MDVEVGFNKSMENQQLVCPKSQLSLGHNGEAKQNDLSHGYFFGDCEDTYDDLFWIDVESKITRKSNKDTLIQLINENPEYVPMLLNHLGYGDSESQVNIATAVRMVRKTRLEKLCMEQGKDVVVDLVVTRHDEYLSWCKRQETIAAKQNSSVKSKSNIGELWNRFDSFLVELNALVCLILDDDFGSDAPKYLCTKYAGAYTDHEGNTHGTKASILHFAACRNLTGVMAKILEKQSTLWNCEDDSGNMPLFIAIQKSQDDAASLLLKQMPNEKVRNFLEEGQKMNPPLFTQIIKDRTGMQKTVESVLDSLIDPDWSLLLPPKGMKGKELRENSVLPNTAVNHIFHYSLLDLNEDGKTNTGCNGKTKSCLRRLVEGNCDMGVDSPYHAQRQTWLEQQVSKKFHAIDVYTANEDPLLRHPVVLMLMRSKWESFGKRWVYKLLAMSLVFLLLLSFALFLKPSTSDRRSYTTSLDQGRLICEILSLFIVCSYAALEIIELVQLKKKYFMNLSNLFDLASCMLLLFGVVPLRLLGGHMAEEFYVSSAAYLISFVRISYMACLVSKSMSIYVYALYTVILREVSRFLVIFAIFVFSFGGSVYLALKGVIARGLEVMYAGNSTMINEHFMQRSLPVKRGYQYSILQEVRVFAEGNGYAETDEYLRLSSSSPVVLGLIMVNMFCGLIILNNILIGQIGHAYEAALENARIQYDVGRVKLCTYIEDSASTDPCCTTKRAKFFKSAELLSDKELEKELGECWNKFKTKMRRK